ncbi:SMI1/KNR4 family protein [Streptomyces adustus]|uniref:SMI1/KNR4 family protein n=1 Tax=Streptomyces adustus TaxID=1609272 RepID=UPI0035DE6A14
MTTPAHDAFRPQRTRHPADARTVEGDDVLIEKLRARAWDPGLRFDTAEVPLAWIEEHFGRRHLERVHRQRVPCNSHRTIGLKAQTEEVSGYFADAPREPLFPPATPREIESAERTIGRPLPELLRRVYTEVCDGGFGPDTGLASLTSVRRAPGHLTDWPCAVQEHERGRRAGLPASWLYLADAGCTVEWHVSLLAADNPVLLVDADGWAPGRGEGPHDGIRRAVASLRQWLWDWAEFGDVRAAELGLARPR